MAGIPALTIPNSLNETDIEQTGLMIHGKWWDDTKVLAFGQLIHEKKWCSKLKIIKKRFFQILISRNIARAIHSLSNPTLKLTILKLLTHLTTLRELRGQRRPWQTTDTKSRERDEAKGKCVLKERRGKNVGHCKNDKSRFDLKTRESTIPERCGGDIRRGSQEQAIRPI